MAINVPTSRSILTQIAQAGARAVGEIVLDKSSMPININPKSLKWLQSAGSAIATVLFLATKNSPRVSTVNADTGAEIANKIINHIKNNLADPAKSAFENGIAYLTYGLEIEGKVHRALLNFLPNAENSHDLVSMQLQDPSGFYLPTVSQPSYRNSHPAMPIPQVNGLHPDTTSHRFGQERPNYQAAQYPNVPPAPPTFPRSASLQQAAYSRYANIPAPPPLPGSASLEQAPYSPRANIPPPPPLVPAKPKELVDELNKPINPLPIPKKPAGLSTTAHSPERLKQQQPSHSQPRQVDDMQPRPPVAAPNPRGSISGIVSWLDSLEISPPQSAPPQAPRAAPKHLPVISSRTANSTRLAENPAFAIAQMNESLGRRGGVLAYAVDAVNTQLSGLGAKRLPLRQQPDALGRTSESVRRGDDGSRVAFPPPPLELNAAHKSQYTGVKGSVHMTLAQRDQCKVSIKERRIVDADGKRYNSNMLARTSISGLALFVMDVDGQVYVQHRFTPKGIDHSSFLSGESVAAAGLIKIVDGKVTALKLPTETQTHYQTTELHLKNVKVNLADALSLTK